MEEWYTNVPQIFLNNIPQGLNSEAFLLQHQSPYQIYGEQST